MNQELNQWSQDDWYNILKTPISFMDLVLGFAPFNYQESFLLDDAQRLIFKAGRQVGKTTVTAIKALHTAFTNSNEQILIIAPTQRQSMLTFNKIIGCIQQCPFIQQHIIQQTQTMIVFDNGSQIHCLPAGRYGFGIMGFSPTMIIVDEAAFVPEEVFNAIIPSLAATNGKLILISTPFGKRGTFYMSYYDQHWSQHTAISEDSPIITKEFLEIEKGRTTDSEFRQWYLGEFVEEVDVFISKDIYQSAEEDYAGEYRPDKDYYLGCDFARFGTDETVMIVVSVDNENNTRVEYIESTSKKPLTDAVGRIIELHKQWNFRMIFADETGLGSGAVDELEQTKLCATCKEITIENYCKKCEGPTYSIPVNPIIFELRDKADMYKHLLWLFERKAKERTKATITIPRMELKLMNQTTSLIKEYTSTGILKVHAPDRGHDDYCFCAGTMISTDNGQVPIEKIEIGDKVLTRRGYKKVIGIGNRMANVIERFGLIGTPDHPFITPNGIQRFINASDKVYIWNERVLCIEEKDITDIPIQKEGNLGFISGIMENGKNLLKRFIGGFGRIISGKYRMGLSSIIRMAIPSIMNFQTLKSCQEENINQCIANQKIENRKQGKILTSMQDLMQFSGINRKKAKNGIENMQSYRDLGKRKVYNISVEDCNEYFANNILVHNCDALALACLSTFKIEKDKIIDLEES